MHTILDTRDRTRLYHRCSALARKAGENFVRDKAEPVLRVSVYIASRCVSGPTNRRKQKMHQEQMSDGKWSEREYAR